MAKELVVNKKLLFRLAKNDFKAKFANAFLGSMWAFVQPLTTMLVFWFVFQVGLKNGDVGGVPFIVWYAPAFLIWTFFSDTLVAATGSIREYSYLVRKVNFKVSLIPSVKIASGAFVHCAFILFIVVLNLYYGNIPTIYSIQVFYYFFCTIAFLLGLSWLFSAIAPFAGDTTSIVGVIMQVGFWATPIVWSADNMDTWIQSVFKLNPMYYICNGYRDAFIYDVWFWERGWVNIWFWAVTIFMLLLGAKAFRHLRPEFADML